VSMDVTVDLSGPVSDGEALMDVGRYVSHLIDVISDKAVSDIRAYLPEQYMYLGHHGGTPLYNPVPANAGELVAAIHSERVTEDMAVVTDTPVTYGPWIEGVSALNAVVWPGRVRRGLSGRFPGYHAFRTIAQVLDGEVEGIAEQELIPYLVEMNR
jgi:hypothetical protein